MAKGFPVFLMAQAACRTCGRDVVDPLTLELLGNYCSQRCLHAAGLPVVFQRGA